MENCVNALVPQDDPVVKSPGLLLRLKVPGKEIKLLGVSKEFGKAVESPRVISSLCSKLVSP